MATAALWFAVALLLFLCLGCEHPKDKPTLWAFGAKWCEACQHDKPMLKQLGRSGRVRVVEIDYDAHPDIAKKLNVVAIPTYILFDENNVPVWRGEDLSQVPLHWFNR